MFLPNVVTTIGYAALGLLVFFIFVSFRETYLWLKDRREQREYNAREEQRNHAADRFVARKSPNIAKTAPKPVTAAQTKQRTPAKNAAPVRTQKPKAPAPVATPAKSAPARQRVNAKWDPFGNDM